MNIPSIGIKIAELRKQKGVTQEEVANVIGTSAQAISKWERGKNYPDIVLLPIISKYFDVSIDTLFKE